VRERENDAVEEITGGTGVGKCNAIIADHQYIFQEILLIRVFFYKIDYITDAA